MLNKPKEFVKINWFKNDLDYGVALNATEKPNRLYGMK